MESNIIYTDVAIVGGGISGTALQYVMRHVRPHTTDGQELSSVLIERQEAIGMLNSHHTQNSQTLHEGDIESNYDANKAQRVGASARLLQAYVESEAQKGNVMYKKYGKMLLAIGKKEVDAVTARYKEFTIEKKIFPNNKLLTREQIEQLEPSLVAGRDPKTPMVAYYSDNGLAIDFGKVAVSFAANTQKERGDVAKVLTGTEVISITKSAVGESLYDILLDDGKIIKSKAVVVSAGGYTPVLMNKMGYGKHIGILSIAGNYYRIKPESEHKIKNKVYMVQNESLPFAALHLDPEVDDINVVRLGPTAFGIPYLENKKRTSFFDYVGIMSPKHDLQSFINILRNKTIRDYIIKNFKFLIPYYGKWLFLKDARKIIPSLTWDDIEELDGYGGTRPQMINRSTHALDFGEARVVPEHEQLIFNITPSPGASTCLGNAKKDILSLMQMESFAGAYEFDDAGFNNEFALVS